MVTLARKPIIPVVDFTNINSEEHNCSMKDMALIITNFGQPSIIIS